MPCANCGAQLAPGGQCPACGAAPTQAARDPFAAPSGPVPPPPPAPGMPNAVYGNGPGGLPSAPAAPWPGAGGYPPAAQWVPVQPLRSLATAVSILLGACAVADLIGVFAFFGRASKWDSASSLSELQDADDFVQVALTLIGLTSIATIVVFIIWFYRARSNTEAWYGPQPKMSKGWAIGGWFIPLANFVIPMIVANDVWNRSDTHTTGRPSGKGLLWGWWLTFTGSGLVLLISFATRKTEDELDDGDVTLDEYVDSVTAADSMAGTASLIRIAAAVLAIFVVRRISAWQGQRMGLEPAAPVIYAPGMMPPGAPGMGAPGGMGGQPGYPGAYPGMPGGQPGYPGQHSQPGQHGQSPAPGWGGTAAPQPPPAPGGPGGQGAPGGPVDLGKPTDDSTP